MLRVVAALALTLSVPAFAADWQRQPVPHHDDVTVELPGTIEHRQRERSMIVGKVVSDTVLSKDDDGWCSATVTRAPRLALRLAGEGRILASARDTVLEDWKGTTVSWEPIVRDGRDGMRLVFDTLRLPDRPERGVAEFFTWDDKVVTVFALRTTTADPGLVERVLGSVDLGG